MRDDLLYLYERELAFLRRSGAAFARKYPKVASRLMLEANKCEDPHVERLLEGFAFLAARVHLKLEDDFSEISEALLNVVYPHYVRPIPAMSVVQFHLDPEQGKPTTGLEVPRESMLYSRPVGGEPCRFRTCYDTTLWPLSVADARWMQAHELRPPIPRTDVVEALRVELECLPDVTFADLEMETLRLYLHAEHNLASTLYELLCNSVVDVVVRTPGGGGEAGPVHLGPDALRPVGFDRDEGMLPFPRRAFLAYRWLQEYFTFPEKYFFMDLSGFDRVREAGFGKRVEVVFLVSRYERADRRQMLTAGVSRETLRPGCSPVINLFERTSEPILLNRKRHEYPVVADARRRRSTGVFSIDEVTGIGSDASRPVRFRPFYSFRHGSDADEPTAYWHARRRVGPWADEGQTEVVLSFVDLSARPSVPPLDAVTARLTCYNGDLPSRLPFGAPDGDFELPGGGPMQKIVALVKPTPVHQPPLGKPQLWRLISQLSLNYLSLAEGGAESLQEVLRLHNFGDSAAGERQIQGITSLSSRPVHARIASEHGLTFARGHRVEIEVDEEHFAGGGVYLFSSVIERFLGLYVSLNSFCMLVARTAQRKEPLREWEPRAGAKALL